MHSISKSIDFPAESHTLNSLVLLQIVSRSSRDWHSAHITWRDLTNYQSISETQYLPIDPNRFTATTVRSGRLLREHYQPPTAEIPVDSGEQRSSNWTREIAKCRRFRTMASHDVDQDRLTRIGITPSSSSSSFISIGQAALSSHVVERTASDWLSARVSTPPRIPNARARLRGVGNERERAWESEKGRERGCERARERRSEREYARGELHPLPPWQNPLARTLPATNP